VSFAKSLSKRTSTASRNAAQSSAEQNNLGKKATENNVLLKKVVEIRYYGKEDVYCLDVPTRENFIANGIVVHNCLDALRYAIFSHFFNKETDRLTPEELDSMYNEAMSNNHSLPAQFIDPREYEGY
jgi:hypothetical protein